MLFYVGGFSYIIIILILFLNAGSMFSMPIAILILGFSLTHPMQVDVGRFSNSISCVLLCEEFLLYSQCCFMWDVSLTILSAMY